MSANKKIAVATSGGADSLALVLMMQEKGFQPIALTVDHGLRKSSKKEALYVAEIMQKHGVEHHILCWQGIKPKTAIEEKARQARYKLLIKWCKKNNVKDLYLGHHKLDQAETFFMRLIRGSGIDGLASMQEKTKRDGINILRPLLSKEKSELESYLKAKKIKWIKDKMNFDDSFLRVKLRKAIPKLEKNIGLSLDRILLCVSNMQRAKDYFNIEVKKFFDANSTQEEGVVTIKKDAFLALHEEMALRVLAHVLNEVSGNVYKPRLNSLEALYKKIKTCKKFSKFTLSHCIIEFRKQGIVVKKEN